MKTYQCDQCAEQRRVLTLHTKAAAKLHFCCLECVRAWALDNDILDYVSVDR